jgi:hypothetical protein
MPRDKHGIPVFPGKFVQVPDPSLTDRWPEKFQGVVHRVMFDRVWVTDQSGCDWEIPSSHLELLE